MGRGILRNGLRTAVSGNIGNVARRFGKAAFLSALLLLLSLLLLLLLRPTATERGDSRLVLGAGHVGFERLMTGHGDLADVAPIRVGFALRRLEETRIAEDLRGFGLAFHPPQMLLATQVGNVLGWRGRTKLAIQVQRR